MNKIKRLLKDQDNIEAQERQEIKMTKTEKACEDWADVCELAHNRTVRECKKKGIEVDDLAYGEMGYTKKAYIIFNKHRDYIAEITGI